MKRGPNGPLILYMEDKMIEGKTTGGFVFKLEDDAVDDMELLEGLIALDNGEYNDLPKTIEALLGKKQKVALYEHYRSKKTGRVSVKKVMTAIAEIFTAVKNTENKIKN